MVEWMVKDQNVKLYSQRNACLDEWVAHYRSYGTKGQTANYIPALKKKNLNYLYASNFNTCIVLFCPVR